MSNNCLVADDSKVSRMMLIKYIKKLHPDWNIIEAENGQKAVEEAQKQAFQVVLLDFNMPVMDGGQAAEQIRGLFPEAKMALITANVQDAIKNMAMNLGIDFIPKPITEIKINEYLG